MRTGILTGVLLLAATTQAAVLDRIAVTVGKDVITESEVIEEIRLTSFLDQSPLDLGPVSRRAAANRLVDQTLIREEMQLENFPSPPAGAVDQTLRGLEKAHFNTPAEYQAALRKYEVTEGEVKAHLSWEVAAMRFTEQRFQPGIAPPPPVATAAKTSPHAVRAPRVNEADRQVHSVPSADGAPKAASVDEQLDAWLQQARSQNKVQFHEEAFR